MIIKKPNSGWNWTFFYHNLYKSNDKKVDCDSLFVNIRGNTQKLNEEDKYSVDDELVLWCGTETNEKWLTAEFLVGYSEIAKCF